MPGDLVSAHAAPSRLENPLQLTYSLLSSGAGTGGLGGWQVKQSSTGLTDEEISALVAGSPTSLDPVETLAAFPTPADIAKLPRRMTYQPHGAGGRCWHAVPAGADSTGRPGNVFTHALLIRDWRSSSLSERVRPIQLWRSSNWLTPFGAAAVEASDFKDGVFPGPAAAITREVVVDFLFETGADRARTMAVLLDAIALRRRGGPPVVVITRSTDEAALWIGVISYFVPALVSAGISFTTYERAGTVTQRVPATDLTFVPIVDEEPLRAQHADRLTIVDTTKDTEFFAATDGDCWRDELDRRVPVTDWSELALDACGTGPEGVSHCFAQLDEVAQTVGWSASRDASWPLAVAVASSASLTLSWPTATRIIIRESPPDLELPPEMVVRFAELVEQSAGRTAREAWDLLTAVGESTRAWSSSLVDAALIAYVARAVKDRKWLCEETPPPLPPIRDIRASIAEQLVQIGDEALSTERGRGLEAAFSVGDDDLGFWCFRLADFLIRLYDRAVPATPRSDRELSGFVDALVERLVDVGDAAARTVARLDTLAPETFEEYIAHALNPILVANPARPGARLAPVLLEWLGRAIPVTPLKSSTSANDIDPIQGELLVFACRRDMAGAGLRPAAAAHVFRWWYTRYGAAPTAGETNEILEYCGDASPWTIDELGELLQRLPSDRLGSFVDFGIETLQRHRPSDATRTLAATLASPTRDSYRVSLPESQQSVFDLYALLEFNWFMSRSVRSISKQLVPKAQLSWKYLNPEGRRYVAPHILLAGVFVRVDEVLTRPRTVAALPAEMITELVRAGISELLVCVQQLGYHERRYFVRELSTAAGIIMAENPAFFVGYHAPFGPPGVGWTMLPFEPCPSEEQANGAPDIASAILRVLLSDEEPRDVRQLGIAYSDQIANRQVFRQRDFRSEPRGRSGKAAGVVEAWNDELQRSFSQWWENVLPSKRERWGRR